MTKEELIKYIDEYMKERDGSEIGEVIDFLKELKDEVIPELFNRIALEYIKCSGCRNYLLRESLKEFKEESRYHNKKISDAPGKEIYADTVEQEKYVICPICGNHIITYSKIKDKQNITIKDKHRIEDAC